VGDAVKPCGCAIARDAGRSGGEANSEPALPESAHDRSAEDFVNVRSPEGDCVRLFFRRRESLVIPAGRRAFTRKGERRWTLPPRGECTPDSQLKAMLILPTAASYFYLFFSRKQIK
jgi:hypothetical protein